MIPTLKPDQVLLEQGIYNHWNQGSRNALAVMPTGGGKTFIFSNIIRNHQGYSVAIAHRQELVTQISVSLAKMGVYHRLIAPSNVIKSIIQEQRTEVGAVFYNTQAPAAVAGVDTLVARADKLAYWLPQVTMWVQDEAHHVLRENKWGKAAELFPNARGLGVTATPQRADGKGLGRHADGLFDSMVQGPSMRELIDAGRLSEYQIYCPPGDFNTDGMNTGKNGDFTSNAMKQESQRSHIVGDVVAHYMKFAQGKRGITFATDVETAHHIAQQYRDAGVLAQAVSAKTPDHVRNDFIRRFRNGDLDQLVNVDLFGEGFDVPAVEVISMARPTQSLQVYMQQFGRGLRVLEGKQYGMVIDHVGNVKRHGLPDQARMWSLDARVKRTKSMTDGDPLELTTCLECYQPYERCKAACPHCGYVSEPQGRRAPDQVDGDLELLDVDILIKMRQDAEAINESPESVGDRVGHKTGNPIAAKAGENRHREKQEAQAGLRNSIAMWAGMQRLAGRPDRESYRMFYLQFGIDVLSAQSLGRADADQLRERIGM